MRLPASAILATAVLVAGLSGAGAQERPERIVSIGGAITEILYALGQEDRVVAVDTTSLHPPSALAEKPDVGYMRALSAEGVLSLSPDLILMDEGAGPKEAVDLIDSAGVTVRHVPTGHSVPELLEKVREVGSAVGEAEAGEAMAAGIAREFEALEADLAGIERKKRVLFILSLVDGRPNAAGSDTGADAIIRLAGGENVFAEAKGYKTLSSEAVAALQPDVILTVSRGGAEPAADPLSVPALAATPAGQAGAVLRMDALYLLGFGPRTPAALRELAAQLYPDLGLQTRADVR
ncbi:heme/hemin ABC transporter substrate-binding protein [Aureimonas populi]|uniref:Hemin ABC transporter substrate-binding protein n=1 Tax=Aureimonas populi TaxID=1701758 RepID=A0ABW5CNV6_9HYPH|nr:ABC transporter substrate-binding protein [Aureimonas populi]